MSVLQTILTRSSLLKDTSTTGTNFKPDGTSFFRPQPPRPNPHAVEAHKKVLLFSMAQHLYTHEIEFILTQRTRSQVTEESILTDFFFGDLPYHKVKKDAYYVHALECTYRAFAPPHKCRPVHLLDVQHHYPHKTSSNAEAPFSTEPFFLAQLNSPIYRERHSLEHTQPRPSFGNMKDIVFDWSRRIIHEIKDGASFERYLYYILLHTKTALIDSTDPNKLRSISGYPRPQNLAYIMLLWSYMAHLKRHPGTTPLLWGYETITGGWLRLNNELMLNHIRGSIITLDKSRFDKYFSFEIQDDIDIMIRSFLDFSNGYIPTIEYPETDKTWNQAKAQRLQNLWTWLCYSFRQCPTVIYDGRKFRRRWFGMPSGCYPTQLYDTIHFYITDLTVLFVMGFRTNHIIHSKGEGDDKLTMLSVIIQPNEHQAFLSSYADIDRQYFGSETRPEKCEMHNTPQNVQVLGYRNNHGIPERDHLELLAQLYHTKSTSPTPSKTMAACVGIAYALMHPDKPHLLRAYHVCKSTFDYYASQGYTPDERSFYMTFYQDVTFSTEIDFRIFPTPNQIRHNLLNNSYVPPHTMKRFWPDWFKAEF